LLGPFEEEEEGSGIASDVVKVEGEDPAIPGTLRSVDTRNPGTVTIPQYRFNKTKQHKHNQQSNYSRNAYKWCAVIEKPSFTVIFLVFWLLLCRHTAGPPITSGTHTGGVQ